MKRKILLIILVLIVLAQFIQPPKNNGPLVSGKDIRHAVGTPAAVTGILEKSCYDCHSDHTEYPWYSKITPVNWWLNNHIREGKKELNFSVFADYDEKRKAKKMKEIAEQVEEHEMPLKSYLWIHKDAALTEAQRQTLITWAKSASGQPARDNTVED